MNDNAQNDLIKVKEDAIRIQEADLLDTFRCIEAENRKSSYVLLFASGLVTWIASTDTNFPCYVEIFVLITGLVAVFSALYNLVGKKVSVHTTVDSIFIHNDPTDWETHLNDKHGALRLNYQNARQFLEEKARLNKVSFVSVALLTLAVTFAMFAS